MKRTVLITGASGLIGSNLVDYLLENDFNVIGLAKAFPLKKLKLPQFNSENYITIEGDVVDRNLVRDLFVKYQPQYIIHLAAQAIVDQGVESPHNTFEVNLIGTMNILDEALKLSTLKRIIIASSDKAYGNHEILPYKEDFELKAIFPYDISKKMTEELAMSYFHTYKLPVVISRCGNVFGKYDLNESRIVPGSILSCLKNEKIVLRSNGLFKRCYVFSDDVSSAYLKMLTTEKPIEGNAFNIGNDEPMTVLDIVNFICEKMGKDPNTEIVIKNNAKFEIQNQYLDCNKAKNLLGWQQETDFKTAIQITIDWYTKYFSEMMKIGKENS